MKWFDAKVIAICLSLVLGGLGSSMAAEQDYENALWDPIHFKPAIDEATNERCLNCHQEILDRKVLPQAPSGIKAADAFAWYQALDTYEGPQETFHRRHLVTPLARELMDMKCSTCHQGHDPREEAPIPPAGENQSFTLRKVVNPKTCLMCHGQFPDYTQMGLPGPWTEVSETFGSSCTAACHVALRTKRHEVNFLKPEAIEAAGEKSGDACYGCHGGRAWYRIRYPYPRHAWPNMPEEVPEWAKDRPTESDARFLIGLE